VKNYPDSRRRSANRSSQPTLIVSREGWRKRKPGWRCRQKGARVWAKALVAKPMVQREKTEKEYGIDIYTLTATHIHSLGTRLHIYSLRFPLLSFHAWIGCPDPPACYLITFLEDQSTIDKYPTSVSLCEDLLRRFGQLLLCNVVRSLKMSGVAVWLNCSSRSSPAGHIRIISLVPL
jgi:hypothetical protein